MQLPPEIVQFIEERAERIPAGELREACAALSAHYRGRCPTAGMRLRPETAAAAYLLMRFPATYAAALAALAELKARLGGAELESCLDLGAGPGAASLAAGAVFPQLARWTLAERLEAMREAARELLTGARFLTGDLTSRDNYPEHDLVIAAYTLGELPERSRQAVLARAWRAAHAALVVIEPGSPSGFAVVRQTREWLLEAGAHLAAPCPAEGPCPMAAGDWCHFAARLERTSLLRRMKGARLSYEDEKFSYVAACRQNVARALARIVRRPEHAPGLVQLVICDGARIRRETVARRNSLYKCARKSGWGDAWPSE
ncbi:MAG: small ribosomal subunit Rsm22 family protein [Bryobacteraceae bacterium]